MANMSAKLTFSPNRLKILGASPREADLTLVAILKVDVALAFAAGVTVAGEKEQVAYSGRPEQAKPIDWLKPLLEVAVMVAEPLWPWAMVRVDGLMETAKFAGALTT